MTNGHQLGEGGREGEKENIGLDLTHLVTALAPQSSKAAEEFSLQTGVSEGLHTCAYAQVHSLNMTKNLISQCKQQRDRHSGAEIEQTITLGAKKTLQ